MRISEWSSDVCSSDLHGADNPPAAILKQQLEVHRDQKLILHNQNRLLHDQLSTRKRGLPERNDDLSLQTTYCIFLFHLSAETVGGRVLVETSTVARRHGRGQRRPVGVSPFDPDLKSAGEGQRI